MAHEMFQAAQALGVHPLDSQILVLSMWIKEYDGNLAVALTDTLGFSKFLKDFSPRFANAFIGVRHDSADPYMWGERMIDHYTGFAIDPKSKILTFSDGLTFPKAWALTEHFQDSTNPTHGIGTKNTCDVGVPPLQHVMKIVECNGRPVAKKSDDPGKGMCEDPKYVEFLTREIERDLASTKTPRNLFL